MGRGLRSAAAVLALSLGAAPAGASGTAPDAGALEAGATPVLRDALPLGPRTLALALHVEDPAAAPGTALRGEGRAETDLALGTRLFARQLYALGSDAPLALGPSEVGLVAPLGRRAELHGSVGTDAEPRVAAGRLRFAAGTALRLGLGTSATFDVEHARGAGDPGVRGRLGIDWQASLGSRIALGLDVASLPGTAVATTAGVRLDHRF